LPRVVWKPEDRKPPDASALEAEIQRIAPGAQSRITFVDGEWHVRSLRPASMCSRGAGLSERDVSERVAQLLADHGHPARRLTR
jgi:hypothetical protein